MSTHVAAHPMNLLRFSSFDSVSGLRHAVSTRANGSSRAPYDSLNLGFHVGDDAARVRENRRLLAGFAGFEAQHSVAAQQTHGASSQVVDVQDRGRGALDWDSAFPASDALIVQQTQIPVLILVADCAPLLFVDARHHVLAVVHAGWRGAVARIAGQTVARMQSEFDSQPSDIQVGIGPCLCTHCFEIGVEVAQQAEPFGPCIVKSDEPQSKPHLDLRLLLRLDLQHAGVQPQNIEEMLHCPRCEMQTLFSHRGESGKTGRFALVAWWE